MNQVTPYSDGNYSADTDTSQIPSQTVPQVYSNYYNYVDD